MWSSRSFVCHREKSIQLAIAHPLEQTSSKRAKITWTNFISHVIESQHNSYLTSLASAKNNKYSCKQSGADDVSATGKCPVFHLNSYEWKKKQEQKGRLNVRRVFIQLKSPCGFQNRNFCFLRLCKHFNKLYRIESVEPKCCSSCNWINSVHCREWRKKPPLECAFSNNRIRMIQFNSESQPILIFQIEVVVHRRFISSVNRLSS